LRPFVDVESEYLAPLMKTLFQLDGTTVRKMIVGAGMVVQKPIQCEACRVGPREVSEAEAAGGRQLLPSLAESITSRRYLPRISPSTDGRGRWARRSSPARLRFLFHDGSVKVWGRRP
jgi:hypothetical protein